MQGKVEKKKSPPTKKADSETKLALFLVFLIIGVVIFTTVFVFRTAFADSDPETEQPETTDSENDPHQPTLPVFSKGTLIQPTQTSATKQITQSIHSEYAILVNAETGEILAAKNGNDRFAPASMTKVMTLIVACEQLNRTDLDRKLTFTQEAFDYVTSGSYAGTEQILGVNYIGDTFKIRDLLYGIGVSSAADCTYLICKEISGSEETFVNLMNAKTLELGLTDTHFDNIIGYESENNYTTACDMAAIFSYAMQCDLINQILCTKDSFPYRGYYETDDGSEASYNRYFSSTLNNRLTSYQSVFGSSFRLQTATLLGGKTGYLKENGVVNNCLVSYLSSTSDGTKYVLVLGCNNQSSAYTMQDVKTISDAYID